MAAADSIIVLDDDDDEDVAAIQPEPSHPSPNPSSPGAEDPSPSEPEAARGSSDLGGKKSYKLENEKLFEEFLELCKTHTSDHPEVVPFLHKLQQRAQPLFLASAEFCNILSRVLSRAQSQPAKLYVYINELCTVLKAHSTKKKLNLAPAGSTSGEPSENNPPSDPTNAETTASEAPRTHRGSRRQIQRLEQLLALYVAEIRRLQERELDLSELDDPDSTYLQEARLKRKLIRLFGRLCELKDCSSLTGRVIEQRIPYRGTRYPEVNRRIERLINRPGLDAFPDYGDVLRAVEKAATRHSLGLPRQQLQLIAQDAFRDVGVRLQERRHLDLIYNFGCHLTDDYRPGIDPALSDPMLARRLRENRSLAMNRLDEVISKYALMQEKSEEDERQKRRARLPQGSSPHSAGSPKASLDCGEGPSGMTSHECPSTSKAETDEDEESDDEEEEEEDDDEDDDDEDEATESEEEDLEQLQEGQGEEEEEERGDNEGARSPTSPSQISTEKNLEPNKGLSGSSGEPQQKGLTVAPASPLEEALSPSCVDAESSGEQLQESPLKEESPASQLFELEIEALPEDISSSNRQSEGPLSSVAENGAAVVTSTSVNGGVSPHTWGESSPPCKKPRKERKQAESGQFNSCVERQRAEQEQTGEIRTLPSPLSPLASTAPVADSSTRVDSPSHGLVTSSLCSPSSALLPHISHLHPPQPGTYKMSVATQCDPEEIIVLSDSD
uniref:Death domain-associated protein 6 n=1 Tax=Jaculus jaculus TaxID=51337 RepID=A0A8C5LA13_JACJA